MKRFFFSLLCLLLLTGNVQAQNDSLPAKMTDYAAEIQKTNDSSHYFSMVMWIPWQYWQTALTQDGRELSASSRKMISTLKEYNIFCVVDAQINAYGGFYYQTESVIRDSLRLTVNDSVRLLPLKTTELDEEVVFLLSILEPTLEKMLGQMGQHLYIYVFDNRAETGARYIDAGVNGKFNLYWRPGASFNWRLPLDILVPPKYCPVDGEKQSGKFIYCPYHGNKLKPSKNPQ